jgi:cell division protein FtsB
VAAVTTRQRKRSPLGHLWLPLLTAGYLAYFGFHAFTGQYGIFARAGLESETERLVAELASVRGEREALERQAARLRPQSVDLDLLDELARQKLNLVHPDEVVLRMGAP